MRVLVDTSIWSLAFRKKTLTNSEEKLVKELKELIYELRAEIIGPIRMELLSGITDELKFHNLTESLRAFDDINITKHDYEQAAELYNLCRRKGIQGSHTDFLICAVAINNNLSIFTNDQDFSRYKKHLNINIHEPR